MPHTIRQQHLHIELAGSEAEGMALQTRLPVWVQDNLLPVLERTFGRLVPDGEHWSLERLEIDAGEVGIDRFELDLPILIEQALEQAIRAQIPAKTRPTVRLTSLDGMKQQPVLHHLEEAWVYFLTNGTLPWGLWLPEGQNLEQTLLVAWQDNPSSRISEAAFSALTLVHSRQRLVRQFSEGFLAILLGRIAPDLKKVVDGLLQGLQGIEIPADFRQLFIKQVWETVFALIPAKKHYPETRIIQIAWQKLPVTLAQANDWATLLESHWPGAILDGGIPRPFKNPSPPRQQPNQPSSGLRTPFGRENLADKSLVGSGHAPAQDGQPKQYPQEATVAFTGHDMAGAFAIESPQTNQHPDAHDGIYIGNAGMVLLHPFLPQCFNALNIAADGQLTQPERALVLLHFLTTGQRTAPEYELALPKLLCNIPLTAPVEANINLTDEEAIEATALLEAVIRHWEALKNTGIDGLRGAYLLRAGKISLRDDGDWRLQVEGNTFDILLNQLPWGISVVRLPWMGRLLWVEWLY